MKKKLHIMTFWAVNGELDRRRLKEQLEEMKECGFDGTIFHPRYYPGKPAYMGQEYLDILSDVILYAKALKMEFWIYDENGWPSGSGDGRVRERFPDRVCQWAVMKDGEVQIESRSNFNTLDREEMQYFIRLIYDSYRLGLEPEAFAYVTGFFSDEVGFLDGHGTSGEQGGIPWCQEASCRMDKLFGEDSGWPALLFKEEGDYRRVRYHYWQILSDILAEAFYAAVNGWCETYGKRYTAHLKGEENIFFQIPYSGSCYTNLRKINTPAVDALERYPGNHYYPRIASSLSRQFGDGECLAEALGGSGWGLKPEDVEKYTGWLAECGINRFAFHLWQYDRNSASVRDWPPNIPWGMNWKAAMRPLIQRLRDRWDGKIAAQENRYLLTAPVRGCMAEYRPEDARFINEHNGAGTPDTKSGRISLAFGDLTERMYRAGLDFDVTEEAVLESEAVLEKGGLRLGNAVYTHVIAGKGCLWEEKEFIGQLQREGVLYEAGVFDWRDRGLPGEGNRLPLEWKDGQVRVLWKNASEKALSSCRIRLMDEVCRLKVNGHCLTGIREESGIVYRIPPECRLQEVPPELCSADKEASWSLLDISFLPQKDGEEQPFAFLEGDFLVKNELPYLRKGNRQLLSQGGFYLEEAGQSKEICCGDLITAGLPFCGGGMDVYAMHYIGKGGILKLGEVDADCALVTVEGKEAGYVWGPGWELQTELEEGLYQVELKLIPSTFNTFGPHHHRDGDRHLVSPDQYRGRKNFADGDDAPENTWIPGWHLVRFGIQ